MEQQQRTCRRCQGSGPFYPSYLANCNYVCKMCASSLVKETRRADPVHLLAYRWYNVLKRRGVTSTAQVGELVASVLQQWGTKSVISGEQDVEQLCIFPYFRDVPLDQRWHYVVVSCREARILSHLHSEEKAHQHFPPHIRDHMQTVRSSNTISTKAIAQ